MWSRRDLLVTFGVVPCKFIVKQKKHALQYKGHLFDKRNNCILYYYITEAKVYSIKLINISNDVLSSKRLPQTQDISFFFGKDKKKKIYALPHSV